MDRGWSSTEAAAHCEVQRTYYSGLETGIRQPGLPMWERISQTFGVQDEMLVKSSRPRDPLRDRVMTLLDMLPEHSRARVHAFTAKLVHVMKVGTDTT